MAPTATEWKVQVRLTDTVYFGGGPIARLTNGQWTDLIYGPQGLIAEVAGQADAEPVYRFTDHLGTLVGNVGNKAAPEGGFVTA